MSVNIADQLIIYADVYIIRKQCTLDGAVKFSCLGVKDVFFNARGIGGRYRIFVLLKFLIKRLVCLFLSSLSSDCMYSI